MASQFFVFGSLWDHCAVMCNDLLQLPNCDFINVKVSPKLFKNKILYFIYKVYNCGLLNKWFSLPYKSYWYRYIFDKDKVIADGNNHFCFFDSNPHLYNRDFIEYLKTKVPNCTLSLVFVNSMCYRKSVDLIDYFKETFDLLYTTDKNDAEKYGLIFIEGIYSKMKVPNDRYSADVFYVGADKADRTALVLNIYNILKTRKICDFTIANLANPPEGIKTDRLSYYECLRRTCGTNTLLEVCSSRQVANTLRFLEAVVYNKILITNNKVAKESKFYDSNTMLVFDDITDIESWNWPSANPDYHYNGEYSPIHLIDDIKNKLSI
jgi:hypothetical protein